RIGKTSTIHDVSSSNIAQSESLMLQRQRRRASIKVLLGIFFGLALFLIVSKVWVRIDHNEDATIGPCTYYGRPLAYKMIAPGLSIMDTVGSIKPLYLAFDIFFWCGIAWLVLFASDMRRKGKI
ncbi:MAG: hypothetical protein IKJ45_12790, partial [Kiritimatiellae bacterium]|nr:hypothetical protein [Kiritimatiellia bacterium]